ncbi:MAG TPA: Rid family hydrolase [Sphingomicrobium sp.]|nr:Rid family hydrolase [Sphingomicrobium sp.]
MRVNIVVLLAATAFATAPAIAFTQPGPMPMAPGAPPGRIPAPGGEVIIGDKYDGLAYARESFAPVRRSGDLLFISGIIVARRSGEGTDVESFKNEVRRTFRRIQHELESAGASFDDVVMINSYHVWSGPDFAGTKEEQFEAFNQVKQEFMHGPHPAWTAVGSTGLLGTGGIVEVQVIAHASGSKGR